MNSFNKHLWLFLVVFFSFALVASPVLADEVEEDCLESSCEAYEQLEEKQNGKVSAPGQAKKLVKGSSGIKGNLKTSQHIYYEGDTIEVSIKFSRGWEMLSDGTLAAHVVVFSPDATLLAAPVDPEIGPSDRQFFTIPLEIGEALPVGQYQLGLIVTLPEGDPMNLADWYNGFRGLMDMEGVLISAEPLPEDSDMDGECDFDEDGDGFCDEETGSDDDDEQDDDVQDDVQVIDVVEIEEEVI